jgi:mRNA-degrading endonuclease RelE of RelBE toxin-antitoxin system
MKAKFEIIFLEAAIDFVNKLDAKSRKKIYYNIDKTKYMNNPKLFEKLEGEIWYFRTKFLSFQYRIFAFWDKTDNNNTLVLASTELLKNQTKYQNLKLKELNE